MKTILSFIILFLSELVICGQALSVDDLFTDISYSSSKFENQLSKNGFFFSGKDFQNDTVVSRYEYRRSRSFRIVDSITRAITRAVVKDGAIITYETSSPDEYRDMKAQLKAAGFYCSQQETADSAAPMLYQNKDLCVRTSIKTEDSNSRYTLLVHKKSFPKPKDIFYANDLLTFTSHEYLVYYFGENNVKKDIFFLSGNAAVKCSVLFINSNRQVVFIWADEQNRRTISSILLGGQQNLKSSIETDKAVIENNWVLKSGLRPGMSLEELRMRNGNDFSFYGGNAANTGLVLPENTGTLDFKKEEVILGCLNCSGGKFASAKEITANECINDGRVMFVLSVMLKAL